MAAGGGVPGLTFLQLLLEVLDLLLELPQQCVLGVLVDAGLVLDVLGAVGVAQCADGLVVIVVRRADVRTLAAEKKQNNDRTAGVLHSFSQTKYRKLF